ncbi:uncharacterized protein TM35_000063820 [Trypanosoma theileri]|uniref:Regulator of chromosome condensation 1-like protein n=1 Tax=Trypanosoma theileri TaxID=67003 RepID=A0A1X0P381_9TRYP|nr:uncharacterized protein TM35_000063820 [Trypanosoma theileri]ORC91377.1 hypothetical protein TM35_000063820 [Trypanosoma theileri]
MFFWGSYNFQAPQLVENPNRPPLRYPVYVPPAPSMVSSAGDDAERLESLDAKRLVVKLVACGQKHIVALVSPAERGTTTGTMGNHDNNNNDNNMEFTVYGMGSNHSGQLGHRVPEYTTTLTKLHIEELLSAGTTITSIACGNKHTLICTSAGGVFAAGDNTFDQLGVRTTVDGFTPVSGLAHIRSVYAAGNVSFALDAKGQVYSWGEAQYGQLGHGDTGERLDSRTLQEVRTNVSVPTLIQWFVRHRVCVLELAVGRTHMVCRSQDAVYTCGDGSYGKLGSGNTSSSATPRCVSFPPRADTEKLVGVAAGDEHTLVLRVANLSHSYTSTTNNNNNNNTSSPDPTCFTSAVVYHFGRTPRGDGQLTPNVIAAAPPTIARVMAGRGTLSAALTHDGKLCVWGKHGYARVSNGTPNGAPRASPQLVQALEPFVITDAVVGGTFVVAIADRQRTTETKEKTDKDGKRWDIVIPHDDRPEERDTDTAGTSYEASVHAFLTQYMGSALANTYITKIPPVPPRTDHNANAFVPKGAHGLEVGQKVRLWMTDIYALGTILQVLGNSDEGGVKTTNEEEAIKDERNENNEMSSETEKNTENEKEHKPGCRFRIEWQRDDWHEEEITLYSDDETLDEKNPNRWQPIWFLQGRTKNGEYVLDR